MNGGHKFDLLFGQICPGSGFEEREPSWPSWLWVPSWPWPATYLYSDLKSFDFCRADYLSFLRRIGSAYLLVALALKTASENSQLLDSSSFGRPEMA